VCLAVEFAHVRGVVHRDLKPANIVLGDYGEVYVLDWGIAKITGVEDGEFTDVSPSGSGGHETEAGTVVGTAGYIAPEQVRGASDIDARVDVYSLGCTLFEILAGERLHPAGFDGLASAVDGTECRPSVRAPLRDVPPELDAVCVQATIGDRDARISSARELGTRVERFLDGDRDLAARRELARTHLARAEAAIAAGDHDDARRIAMQEAGRALALDPSLAAAATLVTRLMIEPPKVTPREVVAEIAATEQTIAAGFLRLAAWLFLGFLAFTPILWWIAPSSSGWVPLLAGAIAGCAGVTWFGSRKPTLWRMLACTLVTTGTLAVVSRMYSPLLIAPGLAILLVVVTTITTVAPTWFASTVIPLFSIVATIGPWLAERAGWLSRTTSVVDEGLVQLRLAAVAGRELPILGVAALYTCMLIGAAAIFATAIRARDHTMKRRLHLQAWQLRQLVAR
jgi:serine/threonine-protein kinase